MFYPEESLKRGGRFYFCWVADSWPLRFATITHRQLWSQDIRRICDDLLDVMTNESGRPKNRFSLRLSSQLMRGLVRLYQKKVSVFLGDLCMINATVTKHVNRRWNIHEDEVEPVVRRALPELVPHAVVQEEPEVEQRIEEIIRNSGNVVGNIQDITLREAAIPQIQLPINDGFGEENPEQVLQLLGNRTLEMMLVQDASAVQHSGLEFALDTTGDKTHDKSRPLLDPPVMEKIDELDVTLYPKSTTAEDRLTMRELDKDVPEIPEIPLLELSGLPTVPHMVEEPQMPQEEVVPIPEPEKDQIPEKQKEPEEAPVMEKDFEIELEELEEPAAKRRRVRRLIVDKKIKLSAEYLQSRIANTLVELRCEDSSSDIVQIRVPADTYLRRPAHAGPSLRGALGNPLTRLFLRNLCVHHRPDNAHREMEAAVARTRRGRTRSVLERIEENEVLLIPDKTPAQMEHQPELEPRQSTADVTLPQGLLAEPDIPMQQEIAPPDMTMPDLAALPVQAVQPEDIADLPTQKIVLEEDMSMRRVGVLSLSGKRKSNYESPPKRQRQIGYVSLRESQVQRQAAMELVLDVEAEKENISSVANVTTPVAPHEPAAKSLSAMLHQAGLADASQVDAPIAPDAGHAEVAVAAAPPATPPRPGSPARRGDSETPLGSLDRTKVSLGDSVSLSESKKFMREEWGTEGTMLKIMRGVKSRRALSVPALVAAAPAGRRALAAAKCFGSILKLKQHGFIKINKDPDTLEIRDIFLGPKFD